MQWAGQENSELEMGEGTKMWEENRVVIEKGAEEKNMREKGEGGYKSNEAEKSIK